MPEEKVASAPKGLTPEQVKERTVSGQMPMMYFNYVRVANSFFDIRLFFGQGNITPQGQHEFHEQLCVSMSLEFAKVLRDSLFAQLEEYEKNFGHIRKPPVPVTTRSTNGSEKKEHRK
jgi:hypothetical protein